AACIALPVAAMLGACTHKPPAEPLRAVRTVEVRYENAGEKNRYVGTVRARHEVDQAFRVGGKVMKRSVEVGQAVRAGDVIAVLDDTDYRLAEEAARQQLAAATAQAAQAESDRKRLAALKLDGSVSASDEERADSNARTTKATAEAKAKELDLARNRLAYTTLHASQSGVVTAVKFEVGQVVAEGQPVVSISNQGEPEIVVDVPEDQFGAFKSATYKASLASAPDAVFDVTLRELSPQAAAQTRTYRTRLKPAAPRVLPLGATATLFVEYKAGQTGTAALPAAAITQVNGQPALWVAQRGAAGEAAGTVSLVPVTVHGYRNDDVLVSGPKAGDLVVTAGVQKMAPGLKVALSASAQDTATKQAAR
ncbi:MAG TPA: efflux RND transporter periplasmic adaptor subunit, partial [Usitatibacter sp.]|nr:efflux RND transporter periplasmic adaptor subunit [Usitatibacter sp.]